MVNPTKDVKNAPKRPRPTPQTRSGTVLPFRTEPGSWDRTARTDLVVNWDMLERQLGEVAASATQRALVSTLVSATRKQAPFKPAELVLREVLCIAAVLMDETFHPGLEEAEMT